MTPDKAVDLVDRLTRKLLIFVAALLTGFFASAALVNNLHGIFYNEVTRGIPELVILCLPLASYVLAQMLLDGTIFHIRLSILRSLRDFSLEKKAEENDLIARYTGFLEKLKELPNTADFNDFVDVAQAGLKESKKFSRLQTVQLRKCEKEIEKTEREQREWYEVPAHFYLAKLVARFVWLDMIILLALNSDNTLVWAINLIIYLLSFNIELTVLLFAMVRFFYMALLGAGRRNKKEKARVKESIERALKLVDEKVQLIDSLEKSRIGAMQSEV